MGRIEPDIAAVRASGNMTFQRSDSFSSSIRTLLDHGEKKLILDLGGVGEIDSLGCVTVIRSYFGAREAGMALCVVCCTPSVILLFQTTRVDTLIRFFPTIAAASEYLAIHQRLE